MGLFNFFRVTPATDKIKEYLDKGAVVIDVRSLEEYNAGHVEGSLLIVLTIIPLKIDEIKAMNKPVIAVCRSGARSGQAARLLNKQGIDTINGGPWQDVAAMLPTRNS